MKKSDIEIRNGNPAVNVKVHNLMLGFADRIAADFKCTAADAERALGFAFEGEQESFWREIQTLAMERLGSTAETFSEGRSGGWLTVHGLEDVASWDGRQVKRWERFERAVKKDIAERLSYSNLREAIEANQWHLPMSEKYNFFTPTSGKPICIAEINQMVARYRADLLESGI